MGLNVMRHLPGASQLRQEAHAKSDPTFAQVVAMGVAECGACYIQVSPWKALGEFREKGGCRAGSSGRTSRVFYIGYVSFDLLAVFGPKREAPQSFMGLLSRSDEPFAQGVVVAKNAGCMVPQSRYAGAR